VAVGYMKKPFVFTLTIADKSDYLLQATSHDDMAEWIKAINTVAGNARMYIE
jgi:hypothetical protein